MRLLKLLPLLGLSCISLTAAPKTVDANQMNSFIDQLMGQMTIEEKIGQINLSSGNTGVAVLTGGEGLLDEIRQGRIGATGGMSFEAVKNMQEASQQSRLKIPLLIGLDVIHGLNTVFPIPLALSCSFDTALIAESARIAAREAAANGVNWTYSPMVDISRDPRWGRVSEGNGEDPWWGSQVARAMVRGYQGDDLAADSTIMACVKHFALYGASEAGRDYNTVDMSRQQMLNDYLPPYQAAFQAGAGSGMSSFNLVDGIPATGNRWLMTDLLRGDWNWDGFIVTDFNAINEMMAHGMGDSLMVAVNSLKAGIDMDMQSLAYEKYVKAAIEKGLLAMEDLDTACRRVLEAKYKLGLFDNPYLYLDQQKNASEPASRENLEAARRIAARSMVLLKNDRLLKSDKNVLPLKKQGKIAVVGPLAEATGDLLGAWVMKRDKTHMISIADAIRQACGSEAEVVTAFGANVTDEPYLLASLKSPFAMFMGEPLKQDDRSAQEMIDEALAVSKDADVIVAVLGETTAMSGEASSRSDISLPETQRNLLKALVATGKPVALVLINGRPLTLEWEAENVSAILEAWAPGTASGYAVADVLFGDYNPSGRLTMTFPRNVGQIPIYYNCKPTGRPFDPVNKFTSKYLDCPNEPLYPFGFGLSYTDFSYGDLKLSKTNLSDSDTLVVSVDVTNTGKAFGEEVVQLYISDPIARISRPVKQLKGIKKIGLQPGETQTATFAITPDDLKYYDADGHYDWDSGEFIIHVGPSSADTQSLSVNWQRN
ncbi:MAG: beta-glucosidase BglX [Bacteroidales bacterium]|nr:beta-glucosidase BglX [Bacteroidales bacterium]